MSIFQKRSFTRLFRATFSAVLLLAGTGIVTPAFSQSSQVTVDLSVLNDGGYGPATIPGYAGGTTKLMMPGPSAPKSTYFGPSVMVDNPVLTAPSTPTVSETESTMALSASDSVPPPAPEPAPEPADVLTSMAAPEPEAIPDAPVASTESGSETVALEPDASNAPPPPAAPEPPESVAPETLAESEPVVEAADTSSASDAGSTETASASSMAVGMAATGRALQIVFADTESKMPGDVEGQLDAIAGKVKNSDDFRIQLMAYAGGEGLSASKARRLSLSRALSVRSFFIENGVRSTRIDVRALGDKTDEQPINRVDVNIVER